MPKLVAVNWPAMDVEALGYQISIDERYLDVPTESIRRQVSEYAAGDRRVFDCTVAFPDSYTGRVMQAMAAIPYGETRTYGDIAAELGSAPRAVGGACGRNPVGIIVPCHRVVRNDGGLGGFSSRGGVAHKARLLEHEGRTA